ncbi:MAG: hypothetical protein PWQ84_1613 [Thermotogaceae bacterium]|jgi:predicted RNA binding protein YcfA (HicA-like mRNA interferase family)|nr:hypothetical protein [Thermotogaceae bacterium]
MSKWDKLIRNIVNMSKDIRFDELKKVLESYGYNAKKPSGGSSHWTFRKKGKMPLTIPEKSTIKTTYIRMVKEIIESEVNNEKE